MRKNGVHLSIKISQSRDICCNGLYPVYGVRNFKAGTDFWDIDALRNPRRQILMIIHDKNLMK